MEILDYEQARQYNATGSQALQCSRLKCTSLIYKVDSTLLSMKCIFQGTEALRGIAARYDICKVIGKASAVCIKPNMNASPTECPESYTVWPPGPTAVCQPRLWVLI